MGRTFVEENSDQIPSIDSNTKSPPSGLPANLFCCWKEDTLNRDGSLSQNQPPRFHLNPEPRQLT
jgi:hypothetical protein